MYVGLCHYQESAPKGKRVDFKTHIGAQVETTTPGVPNARIPYGDLVNIENSPRSLVLTRVWGGVRPRQGGQKGGVGIQHLRNGGDGARLTVLTDFSVSRIVRRTVVVMHAERGWQLN